MAGKHSRTPAWRRPRQTPRRRPIELVDVRTKQAHLLTQDAYAAGVDPKVGYVALCGADILPACLAEPGEGYCRQCQSSIPTQRSRR